MNDELKSIAIIATSYRQAEQYARARGIKDYRYIINADRVHGCPRGSELHIVGAARNRVDFERCMELAKTRGMRIVEA